MRKLFYDYFYFFIKDCPSSIRLRYGILAK